MAYSHAPPGYDCPFCRLAHGDADAINSPRFVVFADDATLAFVAPKWWAHNPGHVLVVPREHHEHIYSIPDDLLARVYATAKRVAVAMRAAYPCAGTSMRQHNEPAGNQDVWHFHVHVFPRHEGDALYIGHDQTRWVTAAERIAYVDMLRAWFAARTSAP